MSICGEMVEWFKAAVLKTVEVSNPPGVRIPLSPPFFFAKKMANEAARLHFTVPSGTTSHLHAATAALHSKGAAFSSLPRRNKMKPGHLHKTSENTYLLVHRSLVRRWMKTLHFIPHCSTKLKLRMKFISSLAIQQIEVILVQDRLHLSFRKSCPAKGAKRRL